MNLLLLSTIMFDFFFVDHLRNICTDLLNLLYVLIMLAFASSLFDFPQILCGIPSETLSLTELSLRPQFAMIPDIELSDS